MRPMPLAKAYFQQVYPFLELEGGVLVLLRELALREQVCRWRHQGDPRGHHAGSRHQRRESEEGLPP